METLETLETLETTEEMEKYPEQFFRNLDPNFFVNLKKITDKINGVCNPQFDIDGLIKEATENQGLDLNTEMRLCTEFFDSINPKYGDWARSCLADPNRTKFALQQNPNKINSCSYKIDFYQNVDDIITLVHETTHNFTAPIVENEDEMMFAFHNYDFLFHLFGETDAITFEYLAQDYLKEKYDIDASTSAKLRLYGLNNVGELYDETDRAYYPILKFAQTRNFDDLNWDFSNPFSDLDALKSRMFWFTKSFSYIFGTLLSNYIVGKIKENPQNISMLDAITSVVAKANTYPDECLKLLESANIPMVHDGKISITEEDIEILTDSFLKNNTQLYEMSHSMTK